MGYCNDRKRWREKEIKKSKPQYHESVTDQVSEGNERQNGKRVMEGFNSVEDSHAETNSSTQHTHTYSTVHHTPNYHIQDSILSDSSTNGGTSINIYSFL